MTDANARTEHRTHKDDECDPPDSHLEDVEVGAGCTEIWEHLAEKREE